MSTPKRLPQLNIPVAPDQQRLFKSAAKRERMTLSMWARIHLTRAAESRKPTRERGSV